VTLALLHYLLATGIVEAGLPNSQGGFEAWTLTPDETIKKIASEWSRLGRDPDVGEIVWFTTPAKSDHAGI
jgi:hypothetical protein